MNEYTLSPAELAVLLNHMTGGRLLEGKASLRDFPVGEQAWAEVEESLLDRGMLLVLPFEEASGVTSQLASVLSAALTPGRICIVRAVHEDQADPPVTFSFTPECITRSYVDAQGRHILAEIADREEAIRAILAAGDERPASEAPTKKSARRGERLKPRALAGLLSEARVLVTLLVVSDPREAAEAAISLAWLETNEGTWLVDGAGEGETPQAVPIARTELRQRISSALGRDDEVGSGRAK